MRDFVKRLVASRWNWKLPTAVLVTALVIGGTVWAGGETLIQGQDNATPPNTRYVLVDSQGRIVTTTGNGTNGGTSGGTHGACTQTNVSVGSTSTVATPATALNKRTTITLVNNSTTIVKCSPSGVTGTLTANAIGIVLGQYDVLTDNLDSSVNMVCVCSSGTCSVDVVECP